MQVNVHEAKTRFSRLLERVALGDEVIIAKAGRPVARLVPIVPEVRERHPGTARGDVWIGPDFDAPLPEDVGSSFE
ncbi:MAG TPA: type II toxin-antitoxin system Phd/YefM family antitoxin [Actinomycetota bacterium]|nr:type II toxin-antitoxin system Phd/YefM family antitoxin [Actinomycetota bacterium]